MKFVYLNMWLKQNLTLTNKYSTVNSLNYVAF